MMTGMMNVVMGAQAGSEAKGKLSGFLADDHDPDIIAGCLAPNAGHTIIKDGKKYVSHHIPVCAAIHTRSVVVMGPASVINPRTFAAELAGLKIDPERLRIDPRAALITDKMIEQEETTMTAIGSTAQGVGLARVAKLMRYEDARFFTDISPLWLDACGIKRGQIIDTSSYLNDSMYNGATVLYEMSQGFDLCLEHGIHRRYCTSRVINPAMAFAESGVSLRFKGHVYGVLRPYPIRVNNRSGFSGPYAEAQEISWEEVGRRCGAPADRDMVEITTTTKLPRRVFEFSWERYRKFLDICDPDFICLQFANYLDWEMLHKREAYQISGVVADFIRELEKADPQRKVAVSHIGTGPEHLDMVRWI